MSDNVVHLDPRVRDTKEFFRALFENADEIENFAIVVRRKEDPKQETDTNVYFSPMTCGDGAWLDFVFREAFMSTLLEWSEG